MMRARLGIDKNNSWADWAEEEEEAAEPTKTLADAKYEVAGEVLGMRLRGGGLPRHASAHGQEGDGGVTLTEGGLPTEQSSERPPSASLFFRDGGGRNRKSSELWRAFA